MPASTSQRRTKPKVRRNSDVIATHNLFYMDGVRRTYGVIVRCCFASSLRFVFRSRFRIRRFVGIRRLIHFIRIGVC